MRQRDPCGIKGLHTPIVSSFLLKSYHLSERKPSKTCGSLEYFPSGDVHGRECLGLLAGSNGSVRTQKETWHPRSLLMSSLSTSVQSSATTSCQMVFASRSDVDVLIVYYVELTYPCHFSELPASTNQRRKAISFRSTSNWCCVYRSGGRFCRLRASARTLINRLVKRMRCS